MQQLNQWQVQSDKIILLSCVPVDLDDFLSWVAPKMQHPRWQIISLETGADRAQLHYRINQDDYLLHYEALCDALWIESMNSRDMDKIRNLIRELD